MTAAARMAILPAITLLDSSSASFLLFSMLQLFTFLPAAQKQEFLQQVGETA